MATKPKIHPAAQLFPMLSSAELDDMAANIQEVGLQVPLVRTPDGTLLDGRNRWVACQKAGVQPTWEVYDGDPWGYVVSVNLHRRHLSDNQRAMIAAKIANLGLGSNQHDGASTVDAWLLAYIDRNGGAAQGSAIRADGAKAGYDKEVLRRARIRLGLERTGNGPDWTWKGGVGTSADVPTPPRPPQRPPTAAQAAELLNVSRTSVDRSRMLIHHGTPDLQQAVEDDVIPLSSAVRTAVAYTREKQGEVVKRLRNGEKWQNVVPSREEAPDRRDLRQHGVAPTPSNRKPPGGIRSVIDHDMLMRLVSGLDGYRVGLDAVEDVGADVTPNVAANAVRALDAFGKTMRKVQRLLKEVQSGKE